MNAGINPLLLGLLIYEHCMHILMHSQRDPGDLLPRFTSTAGQGYLNGVKNAGAELTSSFAPKHIYLAVKVSAWAGLLHKCQSGRLGSRCEPSVVLLLPAEEVRLVERFSVTSLILVG